jgi:hypothetical protein
VILEEDHQSALRARETAPTTVRWLVQPRLGWDRLLERIRPALFRVGSDRALESRALIQKPARQCSADNNENILTVMCANYSDA